jgi:uncharacterized protein (DUF433 family)
MSARRGARPVGKEDPKIDYLGVGLYPIPEAARLLGLPSSTVHRWVEGYSFPLAKWSKSHKPPIFMPALPRSHNQLTLTFLDLLQLRVVQGFRRANVPLQRIRVAAQTAAELFGTSHPLALERFRTDGRGIFADLLAQAAPHGIVHLGEAAQAVFPEMVEQSLREISYTTETHLASRWYVAGPGGGIVVDPQIAFGAPVIDGVNVPTHVVWDQAQSEPEPEKLAAWFRLELKQVQDCLRYEQLARAA